MACSIPLRRCNGTGGSTQRSPYPAADARSAATAARSESQTRTLHHQERIAKVVGSPLSTVARAMKALGLGRLRNLEPKPPVQRYQWEKPGDMIYVDTKQLARFKRVGHRITGDRRQGCSRGAGYEKVHVAIDDATRLAYVEVLPDEQKATTVGFLARAVGWFSEQGITCRRVLSDNGSAYRSGAWRKACKTLDLRAIRTKPYTPRTNGKAERFIQTLCREWAYGMPFQTSEERKQWLPRYLRLYNQRRCHMALGGLSPQQRLLALLTE